MQRDALRVFPRLALFCLPFLLTAVPYFVLDPFKVLYTYDNYYEPGPPVVLNRDFVSTQVFLQTNPTRHYDSFVFGNSRSLAFRCLDWGPLVGSRHCFHFDGMGDTLFGIKGKLRLLDRVNVDLRNVLLILDTDVLRETTNTRGHLYIKSPLVSGESRLQFQFVFLRAFYEKLFFVKYLDYLRSSVLKPYMMDVLIPEPTTQVPETNDELFLSAEQELAANEELFYEGLRSTFASRPATPAHAPQRVVFQQGRSILQEISGILSKHGTRYRVVVSPLYDQVKLHPDDLAALQEVFGTRDVFDFSGINAITADFHNYYELSHFRPAAARAMLAQMYRRP